MPTLVSRANTSRGWDVPLARISAAMYGSGTPASLFPPLCAQCVSCRRHIEEKPAEYSMRVGHRGVAAQVGGDLRLASSGYPLTGSSPTLRSTLEE